MRIVESAGVTDPGRVRRRNEDSYVCEPPLFAVADGMGGAQAGELASRIAAGAFREAGAEDSLDPQARLRSIIQEANRRIYARAARDPEEVTAEEEETDRTTRALHAAVAELPPREREILERRWLTEEPLTLEALGARFGISKERVRQIEERAKQRMRASIEAKLAAKHHGGDSASKAA